MTKIFFLFFIFSLISSKETTSIKLGVQTEFDSNSNNLFKYEYKGPGKDLIVIYLYFEGGAYTYDIDCLSEGTSRSGSGYEDIFMHAQIGKSGTCSLKFEEGKGYLIIYTLNTELGIKLKNKYGNVNLPVYTDNDGLIDISQFTFSVPNLEKDATVKFQFNEKALTNWDIFTMENPFKVCHGNDCKENLDTYDFKKGESYKIMVKAVKKTDRHDNSLYVIPGWTFYDENYDGTYSPDDIIFSNNAFEIKIKYLYISLILLLL